MNIIFLHQRVIGHCMLFGNAVSVSLACSNSTSSAHWWPLSRQPSPPLMCGQLIRFHSAHVVSWQWQIASCHGINRCLVYIFSKRCIESDCGAGLCCLLCSNAACRPLHLRTCPLACIGIGQLTDCASCFETFQWCIVCVLAPAVRRHLRLHWSISSFMSAAPRRLQR